MEMKLLFFSFVSLIWAGERERYGNVDLSFLPTYTVESYQKIQVFASLA